MVSDGDYNGQQGKLERGPEEYVNDDSSITTIISTGMTADSNNADVGRDGETSLPKTLGGGRYLVHNVLGTGSTASTYRCTEVRHHQQHQQEQEQRLEGNVSEDR